MIGSVKKAIAKRQELIAGQLIEQHRPFKPADQPAKQSALNTSIMALNIVRIKLPIWRKTRL